MIKSETKRILLKLSGEALMGNESYGIELKVINKIANDIKNLNANNIQTCIVIGGGNIFRGLAASAKGMERANADYICKTLLIYLLTSVCSPFYGEASCGRPTHH